MNHPDPIRCPPTRESKSRRLWPAAAMFAVLSLAMGFQGAPALGQDKPAAGDDPFDLAHKAPDRTAKKIAAASKSKARKVQDLISFQASFSPAEARPGQVLKLTVTGTPKAGYHTYAFTRRTPDQNSPGKNLDVLEIATPQVKRLWPLVESEPKLVKEETGEFYLEHLEPFTLTQDVVIDPETRAGTLDVGFNVKLGVCDDKGCFYGEIPFRAEVQVKGSPIPLTADLQARLSQKPPPVEVVTSQAGAIDAGGKSGAGMDVGLLGFILSGVFWGFVSLLTPCVFPMIPITVSFFLKQSEKEHHKPITMATVYCATIVTVLTIAAVALLSTFRKLSVDSSMNIILGGLFIYFSLSLFGMYEIKLPNSLVRFTSAREGQGGIVGTIFMALTFTIISFACVAPFLGGFGGTAAGSALNLKHRVLGGLAFAATFALPFFILALFPALLKKMPKSGSWMNTVKVVMGFLELAAGIKFLRAGELLLLSQPTLFTYDFCLGLYVALSLLCGVYLLGLYRLPHDSPLENLAVPRMLFSLAFLSLGFYLVPGLFKDDKGKNQRPAGAVFAWVDSFLLPEDQEDFNWIGDLKAGLASARARGKLVFVDFTGKTCTNCKLNERNVFVRREVKELLEKYELVQLFTDVVPNRLYPPNERNKLGSGTGRQQEDARKNLEFQRKEFDTEQLPLYVILEPLADGGYREVSRYDEGRIIDQGAFLQFLSRPLQKSAGQTALNTQTGE
jgi:thiol:disulfide interchange protein